MKKLLFSLGLLVALSARAADDPRVLTLVELKDRAARPVIIVPPTYPEAAAQARREGTVDVTGTVNSEGRLEGASIEGPEEFAAAVREVIRYWGFTPLYSDLCEPKPTQGVVRVWFEMKGGKPSISVSRGRSAVVEPPAGEAPPKLKVVKRLEPYYPERAIRAGRGGNVEAMLLVDAEGDVRSVTIIPSTTPKLFGDEVVKAMAKWKFEPRPGGPSVCAYYEVNFRLRD